MRCFILVNTFRTFRVSSYVPVSASVWFRKFKMLKDINSFLILRASNNSALTMFFAYKTTMFYLKNNCHVFRSFCDVTSSVVVSVNSSCHKRIL